MVAYTMTGQGFSDFSTAFTLTPDEEPTGSERDYVDALKQTMEFLAEATAADANTMSKPELAVRNALIGVRAQTVAKLRKDAEDFIVRKLTGAEALTRLWTERGVYLCTRERIERAQFVVEPVRDANKQATDIVIRVNSGGANDEIPLEKQTLFIDLTNAATVVNACCERMQKKDLVRAKALQNEFIEKLAACGRVGLYGTHPGLAQVALVTLKTEFFARNASAIKQRANDRLVRWAFGVATVLMLPYFLCRWAALFFAEGPARDAFEASFFYRRKEFFLLAAGAAIGTWLSFSIRNLDLTFEDLGKFEDEYLGPSVRVAFVVALSVIVGLLFWTGAFAISIGGLKVLPHVAGGTAMLVGLFCGLSERALATAVSSRAATFIRGVAGTST